MMDTIRIKIEVIRKLLDEVGNEYHFAEVLNAFSSNRQYRT